MGTHSSTLRESRKPRREIPELYALCFMLHMNYDEWSCLLKDRGHFWLAAIDLASVCAGTEPARNQFQLFELWLIHELNQLNQCSIALFMPSRWSTAYLNSLTSACLCLRCFRDCKSLPSLIFIQLQRQRNAVFFDYHLKSERSIAIMKLFILIVKH